MSYQTPDFYATKIPSASPNVKEIIDRRKKEFERINAERKARRLVDVTVKIDGPYGICHFGDPHCLADDHEILTKRGWLKESQLDTSDEVAGLDASGKFCWQPIKKIIRREVDQDMVLIDTLGVSLFCTPEHRVIAAKAIKGGYGETTAYLAGDMKNSQFKIPASAWKFNSEYAISDDWLRLCAWILTDAYWTKDGTIIIYQSKPETTEEIDQLISRLGLAVSVSTRQRVNDARNFNYPSTEFRFGKESSAYIRRVLRMPSRKIPDWLWNVSRRQFDVFLDTAVRADGEQASRSTKRIYKSLHFLDELQALACAFGYRSRLVEKGNWGVLSLIDKDYAVVVPKRDIKHVKYKGTIWCVSVEHRQFFTRRNGVVHLTGNCDDPGTDIALLEKHVAIVAKTRGMFAGNVGDNNNNWIGRLSHLYGKQTTTAKEAWILVEWLLRSMPWLYVIGGNHGAWAGDTDPVEWILRDSPGVFGVWSARLNLISPNGTSCRINARHDFAGRSMWNEIHGPKKAAKMGWRDHILICGHHHTSGYGMDKCPATGLISHIIRVAGYKKCDAYAEQLGLPDQAIFPSCVTIIDPDEPDDSPRRVIFFADVEAGADYLTYLRSKRGL